VLAAGAPDGFLLTTYIVDRDTARAHVRARMRAWLSRQGELPLSEGRK
jgi:hypothetical protein